MRNLIEIDLDSIKKNPNAGSTITNISLGKNISCEYIGELPVYCKNTDEIIIISQNFDSDLNLVSNQLIFRYEGFIFNKFITERNLNVKNFIIEQKYNQIYHLPEKEYIFKYKKSEVICSECNNSVNLTEIIEDSIDDHFYQQCPKCNSIDSFEIEYQNIKDLINNEKF